MPDLADLFPGFESHWIPAPEGKIFARAGGSAEAPALVLLHGFPQTHVMWHRVAPGLARRFRVIAMDLRGYGWSTAPRPDAAGEPYSKRAMAEDVLAVLSHFGLAQAAVAGHDRGGRAAYRLALDHPGRVAKLATLDIVPTAAMWRLIEEPGSTVAPHWRWLAEAPPKPEERIKARPDAIIDELMASWTATKDLRRFDTRAVAHYRAFVQDPSRIAAMCADYRAGSTLDRAADEADLAAGRTIACPVLALWGSHGIPAASPDPLALWRPYASDLRGEAVEGGHFLPEENPLATEAALVRFLEA